MAANAPANSLIIVKWPNPWPFSSVSAGTDFRVYLKWTAGNKEYIEYDLDGVTFAAGPPKTIKFKPRHTLLAANTYEVVMERRTAANI
jgi:hypothetical protein